MALALRSGLHYRRFDAEYVFFDLAADRYFLLSGVAANRFGRFVSGRASAAAHEHLLASDILAEGSGRALRDGCNPATVTASPIDAPLADAPLGTAVAHSWAPARARRELSPRRPADIDSACCENRVHPLTTTNKI